jgi:hypothetical protein
MIEMRRAQLSFGGGLIDCGRIRIKNLSDALIRDQPACHGCLRLGTSTRHLGTSMPSRGRPPHRSVDYPSDGPASVVVGRAVSTPLFCEEHGAAKSSGPGAHRSQQSVLGDVLERI